jgi:hypothetical protein
MFVVLDLKYLERLIRDDVVAEDEATQAGSRTGSIHATDKTIDGINMER